MPRLFAPVAEAPPVVDLDSPSESTLADLAALRTVLADVPPKQVDRNLLIGTWSIGEVVSRFDVVAIQEVQEDITALQTLMRWLGPDWGLIMTDVTRGKKAGGERLAFVFDTRRVKPSGLAGELVLSAEQTDPADPHKMHEQFARTPYAVAFQSHRCTFILTTVHIVWGHSPKERTPEIEAIADWLDDWSKRIDTRGHDLLVLGDFNIDR